MNFIHALGLDYKLLIAHTLNFLILLVVLKKVLYTPMMTFMDERKQKIQDGLSNAEQAEQQLRTAQEEKQHILKEAHTTASDIISRARTVAEQEQHKQVEATKKEIERLHMQATKEIEQERAQLLSEAKKECAQLVIQATEKILEGQLTAQVDRAFVNKQLAKLNTK